MELEYFGGYEVLKRELEEPATEQKVPASILALLLKQIQEKDEQINKLIDLLKHLTCE